MKSKFHTAASRNTHSRKEIKDSFQMENKDAFEFKSVLCETLITSVS